MTILRTCPLRIEPGRVRVWVRVRLDMFFDTNSIRGSNSIRVRAKVRHIGAVDDVRVRVSIK